MTKDITSAWRARSVGAGESPTSSARSAPSHITEEDPAMMSCLGRNEL
jgi:hypothetical protein